MTDRTMILGTGCDSRFYDITCNDGGLRCMFIPTRLCFLFLH
jgi:hypothetical protein